MSSHGCDATRAPQRGTASRCVNKTNDQTNDSETHKALGINSPCPVQVPKKHMPRTATSWMVLFFLFGNFLWTLCGFFGLAFTVRPNPGATKIIRWRQLGLNMGTMYTPQSSPLLRKMVIIHDNPLNPLFLYVSKFQMNAAWHPARSI